MLINNLKEKFFFDLKNYFFNKTPVFKDKNTEKIFQSIRFEEPKSKVFGDLSTNAAMVLASYTKSKPMDIAEEIGENIIKNYGEVSSVEVVSPGFINFNIKDSYLFDKISEIFKLNENFGKNNLGSNKKIQIEYVSSNPTGNLHIGHGRWGVMGDILSNIYKYNGYDVCREYYVNDYGTQAKVFGNCVKSLYLKKMNIDWPYPLDGYPVETVNVVADKLYEKFSDKFILYPKDYTQKVDIEEIITDDESIEKNSIDIMLSSIKETLKAIGVEFDVWFFESSLYENGNFEKVLDFLRNKNLTYEKEGALWFKSTLYGDDKDRVIIRSDGNPTYFASDIMYLINKKERGFDYLIYILGADHHGYVPRLKAIAKSIGLEDDAISIIIGQLVRIVEGKEVIKMSRRKGRGVTLDDLVEEVGKDAIRFFFSMNSFDTHMDFDISLAKKKSNQNPVFYAQYAYARISSVIRKLIERNPENILQDEINILKNNQVDKFNIFYEKALDLKKSEFKNSSERSLLWTMLLFPDVLYDSCKNNAPYLVNQYIYKLAGEFHYFYNHNIIISKNKVNIERLTFILAARIILKNGFDILGISAPEKM